MTKIIPTTTMIILLLTSPIWAQSRFETPSPSGVQSPSETRSPSGMATSGGGPSASVTTGAFESLSPGNQKIANDLFMAQSRTTGGRALLSRDQIATLKGSEGWGRVFDQMKADGLLHAKNLGLVVSRSEHEFHTSARSAMSPGGRTVAVTNGFGRTTTFAPMHSGTPGSRTAGGHRVVFAPVHSGTPNSSTVGGHNVHFAPANTGGTATHGGGVAHGGH